MKPAEQSAYGRRCSEALEQALDTAPFYAAWRAADPGRDASVQHRYAAMPALTKADIRAHFPKGFVPAGIAFESEVASGRVSYVSTSGSTEDQVTLFWSQAWWDHSERSSWTLNAHLRRICHPCGRRAPGL